MVEAGHANGNDGQGWVVGQNASQGPRVWKIYSRRGKKRKKKRMKRVRWQGVREREVIEFLLDR